MQTEDGVNNSSASHHQSVTRSRRTPVIPYPFVYPHKRERGSRTQGHAPYIQNCADSPPDAGEIWRLAPMILGIPFGKQERGSHPSGIGRARAAFVYFRIHGSAIRPATYHPSKQIEAIFRLNPEWSADIS
jgi:hypothetical protein